MMIIKIFKMIAQIIIYKSMGGSVRIISGIVPAVI